MARDSYRPYAGRAGTYAAYRWDYAPDAVRFAMAESALGPECRVADLGSGTGMLTRHFVQQAGTVFAVEPEPEMRRLAEQTLGSHASFRSIAATAEETGLPDASIDLVTVGQALHWFDPVRTRAEMLRILRPEGRLAVFWNRSGTPALSEAIRRFPGWRTPGPGRHRIDDLLPRYFGSAGYVQRTWETQVTEGWDRFLGSLISAAPAPRESDPDFGAFRDAAHAAFDGLSTRGVLQVAVITEVALGRPGPPLVP